MSVVAVSLTAAMRRHVVRRSRRVGEAVAHGLLLGATAISAGLLLLVVWYVVARGLPALDFAFFTQQPLPFGEVGGGVAPAIVGTVVMSALAAVIAVPVGVAAAVFTTEMRAGRFAEPVRFAAELIAGLPSIVVGVFVWAALVRTLVGNYAGIAGAVALAVIMVPIVTRTVEEVLRLVPNSLREAGLALGAPRWRVVMSVVIPTARAGIVTGVVLALARAAGETAPLMLTALGNVYFSFDLTQPMAALPLQIYQYAVAPYDDWHTKAWGSSLVLLIVVGVVSLSLRLAVRRGEP